MRSKGLMASAFALAVLFGTATAAPSWAALKCTGPVGAVEIKGKVHAGPGCDLSGATVRGNVIVEPGGSLSTNDEGPGAVITGNVEGRDAVGVGLDGPTAIGGRLRLTGTTTEGISLHLGSVGGNIEIEGGTAYAEILKENVGGNVQVLNTSGEARSVAVVGVGGSNVRGNVELANNSLVGAAEDFVGVVGTSVAGKILIFNNTEGQAPSTLAFEARVSLSADHVGGNAELLDNTTAGSVEFPRTEVSKNVVTNILNCLGNVPPPFGTENIAKQKLGECEHL